ncbi:MAG: hypothetical protein U0804_11160 [Gemmataceae bacterium]
MRKRIAAGVVGLGVLALAGAWGLRVAGRPHAVAVPVPVGGRLDLDQTPFGEAAFAADRLTAEFRAALAPGRYALGADVTLDVPAGTSAGGSLDLRVTGRGEADGRRWIDVTAEPSRVAFSTPVRVTGAAGWVADLHKLTADPGGVEATAVPVVGRSVANWVAARVWSAPSGAAEPPGIPVREVTVTTARLALRENGRVGWRDFRRGDASVLAVGPGSTVDVCDLVVTAGGHITDGRLTVNLKVGADSVVRGGGVEVRAAGGDLTGTFTVRRDATDTRVSLPAGAAAAVRLVAARVTPAAGVPDLGADRLDATVDQADWAQPHGGEPVATVRTTVRVAGVTVPAALAGLRVESVTGAVAGDGNTVRLDDVTVRLPKAAVLAAARAALPKSVPLPDQPVADNVAELFRDVKLTGIAADLGAPTIGYENGRVVFAASPVVRGRVTADGRQAALEPQERVVVVFGREVRTTVQVPVVRWVPQVSAPFTVPLTVRGTAAVEVVPGPTLAAAALLVRTNCDSAEVGEPTVDGLPAPVRPLVQLAARFRDRVRVDGQSPAEFVRSRLTREDTVPLFAAADARTAAALARVTASALRLTEDGGDLLLTASLGWSAR